MFGDASADRLEHRFGPGPVVTQAAEQAVIHAAHQGCGSIPTPKTLMCQDHVEDIGLVPAVVTRDGEPQESGVVQVAVVLVGEAPRWIVDDGAFGELRGQFVSIGDDRLLPLSHKVGERHVSGAPSDQFGDQFAEATGLLPSHWVKAPSLTTSLTLRMP